MNSKEMNFFYFFGMPLMDDELLGTEKDGSVSADYCKFCYDKGDFVAEMTMDDMINFCAPKVAETQSVDIKEAKKQMEKFFPSLKRWKQ
jgi:hypothetical protein